MNKEISIKSCIWTNPIYIAINTLFFGFIILLKQLCFFIVNCESKIIDDIAIISDTFKTIKATKKSICMSNKKHVHIFAFWAN